MKSFTNLARSRELIRLAKEGPWPFTLADVRIPLEEYRGRRPPSRRRARG